MPHLKPLLTVCLCLTMLVTSATGAFARGQMAFGQTLQICAEGEVVTITLDGRGLPVRAARPCPECFAVVWGLPPNIAIVARPLGRSWQTALPFQTVAMGQSLQSAQARGPPILI